MLTGLLGQLALVAFLCYPCPPSHFMHSSPGHAFWVGVLMASAAALF
ncbi:hypothetical protein [Coxiella endosymbiont of Ornithodoros amblus]|nr:hypothetical protein [Coxiella endosymbiont of Ornithodoros amblus]